MVPRGLEAAGGIMLDGIDNSARRVHLDGADLAGLVKLDILDTITNLSNDEVFTPPRLANQVLDLLPEETWRDPAIRLLDPVCKTGVFLREATRRFMDGLAEAIPDPAERRAHILRNQVFGVAISEITWLMTRRTLYGAKDASSDRAAALTARMDRPEGNIVFPRREHDWDAKGKCRICGIGREIERDGMDNYAYALIHGGIEKEFGDVQFDVIIGNPPYQVKDGGHGASATPIYHKFVQDAKAMRPRFLSMIIPARWYAGGKGLDEFRAEMLADAGLSRLVDIRDASDAFSGVEIKGGVCYFRWDSGKKEPGCEVRSFRKGEIGAPAVRDLGEHDVLIRDNEAVSILQKVLDRHDGGWLSEKVSSRKPFGFPTNFTDFSKREFEGAVTIYARGEVGWIDRQLVPDTLGRIDCWKVFMAMAAAGDGQVPNSVIGRPIVATPGSCCTETYLVAGSFATEDEAQNLKQFLQMRFSRFLISLKKNTQHVTRDRFTFVPDLPMTETWTDEKLYAHFGITADEQAFIESMIRKM